jgi:hypothetical protein
MSAKEQAIEDIKDDLKQQSKCFIAFRKELNKTMRQLVYRQIQAQKRKALCLSQWTNKSQSL